MRGRCAENVLQRALNKQHPAGGASTLSQYCERYILRQIPKYRSGDTGQTIHKVDKREWAAVNPLLLRDDKLQYVRFLTSQGHGYVMLMLKHSFDYSPSIDRLVLRMPTKVHEQFSRSLSGRVSEQLRLLSLGSGSAAEFAKDLQPSLPSQSSANCGPPQRVPKTPRLSSMRSQLSSAVKRWHTACRQSK